MSLALDDGGRFLLCRWRKHGLSVLDHTGISFSFEIQRHTYEAPAIGLQCRSDGGGNHDPSILDRNGNDMTFRLLVVTCLLLLNMSAGNSALSQDQGKTTKRVRLGGHAYAPTDVTVFKNLTKYLNSKGFKSDFVLYGDHEALIEGLGKGDVDIAWMSPVQHGKYHVRNGWDSQTLAMRDVDRDLRVTLIVRPESGIKSAGDLAGKRLIVGRSGSQDGSLLPLYYFREAGVNVDEIQLVDLKGEKDANGKRADSTEHIMQALSEGRGDAAVVLEQNWKKAAEFRKANPSIKSVWLSPEFCHCTFTAPGSFDKQLGSQFTKLMTSMDRNDPIVAELLRLENAGKFLQSDSKGFKALYQALGRQENRLPVK